MNLYLFSSIIDVVDISWIIYDTVLTLYAIFLYTKTKTLLLLTTHLKHFFPFQIVF